DLVVDASRLTQEFGEGSFDVVISTEMLEHVRDWRNVIHNLKAVLKEGGLLIISTRSKGFRYHAYPYDFWRYEIEDISQIFSDMEIIKLDKDAEPGVLMKARKPINFVENRYDDIKLYSIVLGKRVVNPPKNMKYGMLLRQKAKEILCSALEKFSR
ncbi:MAG: methyltransferase domain-containing protein, partial [Candidatus Parvarchaeota archaeon]